MQFIFFEALSWQVSANATKPVNGTGAGQENFTGRISKSELLILAELLTSLEYSAH